LRNQKGDEINNETENDNLNSDELGHKKSMNALASVPNKKYKSI